MSYGLRNYSLANRPMPVPGSVPDSIVTYRIEECHDLDPSSVSLGSASCIFHSVHEEYRGRPHTSCHPSGPPVETKIS